MNHSMSPNQFARHMEASSGKFYRLAYCYVKKEHDALEIVSEATYRGLLHLNRLEKPEYFDTWMSRIIINCACDYLKKQGKYQYTEPDDTLSIPDTDFSVDDRLDLYQALDTLAPDERSLIILKYFEEKSFREIADILNIPESTAKSRLYHSLTRLKALYREA